MVDLRLPQTDTGVDVQLVVFAVMADLGIWLLRRNQEWRLVAIGVALVGMGFIGFRALH